MGTPNQGSEKKKGLPKNVQIAGFGMLSVLFMVKALSTFFSQLGVLFFAIACAVFVSFIIYLVVNLTKKQTTSH